MFPTSKVFILKQDKMKRTNKLLLALATVAMLFTSCQKEEVNPLDRLSGQWRLNSVSMRISQQEGIGGETIQYFDHQYIGINFGYASALDVSFDDITYNNRYVYEVRPNNQLYIDGKGIKDFFIPVDSKYEFKKGVVDTLILQDLNSSIKFKLHR